MKYLNRKVVFTYLYDQLTGNFMGFLVGLSATGLVSQFFEKRGIRNLWGLTSRKTVVDKDTFAHLEWIISIVIGFVVFEIMTKVVKAKVEQYFPALKRHVLKWAVKNEVPKKIADVNSELKNKQAAIYSSVQSAIKNFKRDDQS